MTPIEVIESSRRSAQDCGLRSDPSLVGFACGFMPIMRDTSLLAQQRAYAVHVDAHLAAAIRADRETVAREAWECGYTHDTDDEHECPHEFRRECMEATAKRLAEEGA